MARSSLVLHVQCILALVLVFDFFCEVVSEYCGSDQYCQAPFKCCPDTLACCADRSHNTNNYFRGLKLKVWNMWYFWLVVIFILMSCFGGCGYYRRQRLAALQLSASSAPTSRRVIPSQRRTVPPSGMYAYTGPGADSGSTVALPPPYTEVMQQPDLYPVNKTELPPYPGPPADKHPSQVNNEDEVNPPPYCEVTMPPAQPYGATRNSEPSEQTAMPVERVGQDEHGSRSGSEMATARADASS